MIFTMSPKPSKFNKAEIIKKTFIVLFWLLLWEIVNIWVGNDILLVGPITAVKAFFVNLVKPGFLLNIGTSFGSILLGLLVGFILGVTLGIVSYRFRLFNEVFSPFVSMLKSIPVASFVVILLIWAGPRMLATYISLLIVFPTIYVNVKSGLEGTGREMLEMAEVFGMSFGRKLLYVYKPALSPFLKSSLKISVGMGIKSGIAAEIIGLPSHSIGERLYMSKISLSTADLFAWTVTIILVGYIMEKIILFVSDKLLGFYPYPDNNKRVDFSNPDLKQEGCLLFTKISKTFGDKKVLGNNNFSFELGKNYCVMGPSGCGKTTLFKLMMGLIAPDEGHLESMLVLEDRSRMEVKISTVFQDDRLIEDANSVINVMAVSGVSRQVAEEELSKLLEEDVIHNPVSTLSGGQKRRVSIVRAMLAKSTLLLLDEPFTGLDDVAKKKAVNFILDHKQGRTVVMSSHDKEEAKMMDAKIIQL